MEHILELKNISKSFRNTKALDGVSLTLYPGEIHALLGENGAGKSTVLNIISGTYLPDAGEMIYKGEKTTMESPMYARKKGIVMVHQELQLVPEMTVYENIFLADEIVNPITKFIDYKKMESKADELLKRVDADFKSCVSVKSLSIAQQQMVEIAKALHLNSDVMILDEPTSSLTDKEIEKLFVIMEKLRAEKKALLFVSHRMEEIFRIADRITIFRDGKFIDSMPAKGVGREELIYKLTGRKIQSVFNTESLKKPEGIALSVRNLKDAAGKIAGDGVSFDLYKGEILGFSGLVGSGRTETVRLIFGADKIRSGEIKINGNTVKIKSIRDSIKQGIALIPENRKLEGFVGTAKNMNNIGMCSYDRLKRGLLFDRDILKNAKEYMKKLHVKPEDPMKHTQNLSGGNQQKVVLAKWLCTGPKILIMDEPTRGVDIGAKEEIYKLMNDLTRQGVSIIMISSELPEILMMSNRIMVMFEGKMNAIINREDATEEKILNYAMGGTS
ncbi:Ribose import ATP-binding protein RbsA [uncultured Roseburia sp.]|uniref:Sugar ABC transporter ATP-binding protein n=1 Tax=Brotonthovivens ammoniilytica TaxID=2981725 RepID=A0ABT2TND3_9FIRM|nr:sugar ABC transporter ATP-binding protein [Brotonthovivens ammoniilytica]MCU6763725.1 sugar ABC transporter ATP-binding protein [Brotonthovivens ammoniilytica]SCJ32921.1 Ribose import ATP-binding protein RbsA [uncultured Roseburia sp.]